MILTVLRRVERWIWGDPPDPGWPRQTPVQKFAGSKPGPRPGALARAPRPRRGRATRGA